MTDPFSPMSFRRGKPMKNRFMLAPLTNHQSHDDGTLSDDEFRWLTMRARGGFGLTMTCAAHVQAIGRGFPGQLGVFGDEHVAGLSRLAGAINDLGSVSIAQLHHAGIRAPEALVGATPVGPSEEAETASRALTTSEVERLRDDFIEAAVRCERAGFDGVEVHGAHGYIVCAFLSPELNRREDAYGGDPEGRARLLREIVTGIRERTGPEFQLGVRLSPERFGLLRDEIVALATELMTGGEIDFLDMSLWDCFQPVDADGHGTQRLIDLFAGLPRGETRLAAAGALRTPDDVRRALDAGLDFVVVGRGGILHHDFPRRMAEDAGWQPLENPVPEAHLVAEGLGPAFIGYMKGWAGFVEEEA